MKGSWVEAGAGFGANLTSCRFAGEQTALRTRVIDHGNQLSSHAR